VAGYYSATRQHKRRRSTGRLSHRRLQVRRAIRSEATEFRYERSVQPMPKLGAWRKQLDELLAANEAKPPRERLTLVRLFETLRDLGFNGGYDAVNLHPPTVSARCFDLLIEI